MLYLVLLFIKTTEQNVFTSNSKCLMKAFSNETEPFIYRTICDNDEKKSCAQAQAITHFTRSYHFIASNKYNDVNWVKKASFSMILRTKLPIYTSQMIQFCVYCWNSRTKIILKIFICCTCMIYLCKFECC